MAEERAALIPAAYVLLRRRHQGNREVLLQLRQGTGFMDDHWACGAAGHVRTGESVFEAAVREAREELGVAIDPTALVPLTVVQRRHEDDQPINQRIDIFFAADEWQGEPRVMEADKSGGLRWIDLDELEELDRPVVPHELRVLEGLAQGDLPHLLVRGF